ncbi:MAG: DNA repair protein RadC [Anaerolineae bacterium]|nr:DNA repair protein RadC [Anaerolineae bacterium]
MKLHYLPPQDHPVHRVAEAPAACNTTELLAALVGGPRQIEIAEELLRQFGSLRAIVHTSIEEIAGTIRGIGMQTAARLISALELGKRLATEIEAPKPGIHCPKDIADLVQYEMGMLEQEELWVLLLNTRNRVIDIHKLYRGTKNQSTVLVGEIFRQAVRRNAAAVVVCHNHPSNIVDPSPEDIALTRAIVEAGKLLDIQALDHLILGRTRWVSLKERKLGFS